MIDTLKAKRNGKRLPYYVPVLCQEFVKRGVKFLIGVTRGYTVGGPIDIERNGIFIWCVTDDRETLSGHEKIEGGWRAPADRHEPYQKEIERIVAMSDDAFEEFLKPRARYNPFADRKGRKKAAKADKCIRKLYGAEAFTTSDWMKASEKRSIVHDFERLVVARLSGGKSFARSRLTTRVYKLFIGPYSHIAHYDLQGFYDAQLEGREDFLVNLQMVANGEDNYGFKAGRTLPQDYDLFEALAKVATAYLGKTPVD